MNLESLINLNLWQKIATIVDIIPKTIYFLYAALASAVDAMQALIRRLAGLDTYWRTNTGAEVSNTDPLTEFIYGILGFGESSSIYSALNTVFWSLAIFGLIVLVVTTMVAMIKSHYNEDTTQTNPWKYIYTAIKSILTFVILPVVIILGLQLSTFVLRTLDNITSGAGAQEEIVGMYGEASMNRLKSFETDNGRVTYAHYDMFGAIEPSTNTTFSGMMFNACMYNANRARNGSYSLSQLRSLMSSGGTGFFGYGTEIEALSGSAAQLEYAAGQVDYAFANCLQLTSGYSYDTLVSEAGDSAPVAEWSDWYGAGKTLVNGFSKYDVSTVWIFYNLWQFNMIVGFAGVFVTFAIMISIVLGLMSRLFKGAALFLIYPSILGITPLDDFKAFKSWAQTFMQQVMMAFGSIVGINLLLLILPYVQMLQFFESDMINYIVNVLMMIAGLVMAKDFIQIVSGFVGGADANSAGGELKGQVAGAVKSGINPVSKVAGGVARVTGKTGVLVGRAVGKIAKAPIKAAGRAIGQRVARREATRQQHKLDKIEQAKYGDIGTLKSDMTTIEQATQAKIDSDAKAGAFNKAGVDAYRNAKAQGYSDTKAEELRDKAINDAKQQAYRDSLNKDKNYQKASRDLTMLEAEKAGDKRYQKLDAKVKDTRDKYHLTKSITKSGDSVYKVTSQARKQYVGEGFIHRNKDGSVDTGFKGFAKDFASGVKKDSVEWGKSFADSVLKTLDSANQGLGLDKVIKGITGQAGETLTYKGGVFKPRKEGDALQRQIAGEQKKSSDEQTKLLREIAKKLDQSNSGSGGPGGGTGGSGGSGGGKP